ncbi:MAG: four helix bundle protein [Bacteroidota bacterium]
MRTNSFIGLKVWCKAIDLAEKVYKEIDYQKDFNFKNQITKATISISNNIAEGQSRGTKKEFSQFLRYAYASSNEVISMLFLAERLEYIDNQQKESLINACEEINKVLFGLKKSLNT